LAHDVVVPVILVETVIHAPIEVCFDLARSVEAHLRSTARTGRVRRFLIERAMMLKRVAESG
jgi:hypothetical protein